MKRAPKTLTEREGMADALERLRRGRRVKPTEADAHPVSTFPGAKHKPLDGQLLLSEESPRR